MFNDIVDVFHPHIHKGNVYFISRGALKFANKKFSPHIKHEYELTLDRNSIVQQAPDDGRIGGIDFEFIPISAIVHKNRDDVVDIIGIVLHADSVTNIKVQKDTSNEREIAKRNLTLIDTSGASIDLTLWGQHAETINEELINSRPVLALKGVKVSEFNSRTLNCSGAAQMEWNPNLEEAAQLRAWFDNNPDVQPSQNLSERQAGAGAGSFGGSSMKNAPQKTFSMAKENPPSGSVCCDDFMLSIITNHLFISLKRDMLPELLLLGSPMTIKSLMMLALNKAASSTVLQRIQERDTHAPLVAQSLLVRRDVSIVELISLAFIFDS